MSRIRITGGEWRSRLIRVMDAPGLRPTPDRVRETLFNWLGQDLTGWRCLDLFAGSGILGLECASRGAAEVVLVENQPKTFAQLRGNAATFACDRLRPVRADALEFVTLTIMADSHPRKDGTPRHDCSTLTDGAYDLILLDPPYARGWLELIEPLLPGLAGPGTRIYAEAECRIETLGDWRTVKHGRAGLVFYHLLEHSPEHS